MTPSIDIGTGAQRLLARYLVCRRHTLELVAGLSDAELALQHMPGAQTLLWHLAHTSWYFEASVLERFSAEYQPCSRYENTPAGALRYRDAVDTGMAALLNRHIDHQAAALVELALEHEEQHQERMLTDMLRLPRRRFRPARTVSSSRTCATIGSSRRAPSPVVRPLPTPSPERDSYHA